MFASWSGDASGSSNPLSITMENSKTIVVEFTPIDYFLTVDVVGQGIVNTKPEQPVYHYEDLVTLSAIPKSGWLFKQWAGYLSGNLPVQEIIIDENKAVTATFEEEPPVNYIIVATSYTGGEITPTGTNIVYQGIDITFNIMPDFGYRVEDVLVDGTSIGATLSHTFADVNSDHTIEVLFELLPTCIISLEPGTISGPLPDVGDTVDVDIKLTDAVDIMMGKVSLRWDPSYIEFVQAEPHPEFGEPTLFVTGELNEVNGILGTVSNNLLYGLLTGSAGWVKLRFRIIDYGSSEIEITFADMRNQYGNPVPHQIEKSCSINVDNPLHAYGPTARFTPDYGSLYHVGDVIELDASSAIPGFDILPFEETCPIIEYHWDIDIGDDGVVDQVLSGLTQEFIPDSTGVISVTLTVTANDPTTPSDALYSETDMTTNTFVIQNVLSSGQVDVYTERGGEGYMLDGCAYGPQEEVIICALVTYNGAPQWGKDVHFNLTDPLGTNWLSRIVRTDDNGIACISFRLPWVASEDPEELFGEWGITTTVDLAGNIFVDTHTFIFGYLLEWVYDTTIVPNPVNRGNAITVSGSVSSIACEDLLGAVTTSVYDDVSQVVSWNYVSLNVNAESNSVFTMDLSIPPWAFIGVYGSDVTPEAPAVYLALFNPDNGLPYCPEDIIGFDVK
jgi:hypothetical protein